MHKFEFISVGIVRCILIEFNVKRHQCGPTFYHFIVCMAQHWCLLRERERVKRYARQTIMVQQSDWTFDWHIWQWCENKRSQKWLKEPNSFMLAAFCLHFNDIVVRKQCDDGKHLNNVYSLLILFIRIRDIRHTVTDIV